MLEKIRANLAGSYFAEHYRWVHWLPVGLIFGIASYFSLNSEPELLSYLCLAIIAVASIVWTGKNPNLGLLTFLIAGFCLGFCLTGAKVRNNQTQMFNTPQKTAQISGQIESIENHPYKDDETLRIIINQVKIDDKTYTLTLRSQLPH